MLRRRRRRVPPPSPEESRKEEREGTGKVREEEEGEEGEEGSGGETISRSGHVHCEGGGESHTVRERKGEYGAGPSLARSLGRTVGRDHRCTIAWCKKESFFRRQRSALTVLPIFFAKLLSRERCCFTVLFIFKRYNLHNMVFLYLFFL